MNRLVRLLSAALITTASIAPASADPSYPNRPIRLIVPTPPGGPSDSAARLLAQAMSRSLAQPITIENRPGAGGAIGAQALVAAPADGYTLMWTLSSMSGLSLLQKSSPFQSLAELTPVALVGHLTYAVFVHPDVPAKSITELVAHARANPDKISYATGSLADYMATTRFTAAAGVRAVRVPYRGGPQLMPDLISGRVQLNFGPLGSGLPYAREGKLRILAVLSDQRSPLTPEVPTQGQAGIRGIAPPSWQAVYAPANTPTPIVERLSTAVNAALADPAVRAQLEQMSLTVEGSTPQRLAEVAAESGRAWRGFVTEFSIEPE